MNEQGDLRVKCLYGDVRKAEDYQHINDSQKEGRSTELFPDNLVNKWLSENHCEVINIQFVPYTSMCEGRSGFGYTKNFTKMVCIITYREFDPEEMPWRKRDETSAKDDLEFKSE